MSRLDSLLEDLREEWDYYRTNLNSPPSIKEVIRRYADDYDKPRNYNLGHWYPPSEVWPHREYTWSRTAARRSPEEWDALEQSMRERGWNHDEPLILYVGRDGSSKVGEGNHRLAIAMKLKMRRIPVAFILVDYKVKKSRQSGRGLATSMRAQKVSKPKPRKPGWKDKPRSPEDEASIDRLMKLLSP
jgi:hypothetical protein